MTNPSPPTTFPPTPVNLFPMIAELHPTESPPPPAHRTTRPRVTVVVPAMNERDTLATLRRRIGEVASRHGIDADLIWIDDGSSDDSWSIMSAMAANDRAVTAIRLRRNFGKAAALSVGFAAATGDIVVTMDADLQDDPNELPAMIAPILAAGEQRLDVVSGWKKKRHDPWHKVGPSRVFNALVSRITGVRLHDHNCGFKAYRAEVLREVDLYGERHRFIPVLAAARGYRVGERVVQHHARAFGQSKYGVERLAKGFLDLMTIRLLTGYGRRPLHAVGAAGLACFAAGAIGMFCLSAAWVLSRVVDGWDPVHLHASALFYYCITAVLLGAQCVLAGLVSEVIVSHFAVAERWDRLPACRGTSDRLEAYPTADDRLEAYPTVGDGLEAYSTADDRLEAYPTVTPASLSNSSVSVAEVVRSDGG